MDLAALVDVLAAAVEVHLVGRVLNGLPLRESEIGASGLCGLPVCLARRVKIALCRFCLYGNHQTVGRCSRSADKSSVLYLYL